MIFIRNFRPADLSRVYDIEKQSFKDPYHVLFLINLYDLYPDGFFVAEKDGIVIGYAISRVIDTRGHVLAIAIAPEYRLQGIGKALMNRVIQHFLDNGIKSVWLEVRASNRGALMFYKKLGFYEVRVMKGYYSDKEDAVVLEKRFDFEDT